MANNMPQHDLIRELVSEAKTHQTTPRRKANTVTAAVGAVVTALAAGGTYILESDLNLDDWVPLLVMAIGLVGTVLGVSQTRNGITDSVEVNLRDELARRIDENHYHGDEIEEAPSDDLTTDVLRGHADQLAETAAAHPGREL